jgi:hypothetical protein
MPPTVHIIGYGSSAYLAEAILFGEVFDLNDCTHLVKQLKALRGFRGVEV